MLLPIRSFIYEFKQKAIITYHDELNCGFGELAEYPHRVYYLPWRFNKEE